MSGREGIEPRAEPKALFCVHLNHIYNDSEISRFVLCGTQMSPQHLLPHGKPESPEFQQCGALGSLSCFLQKAPCSWGQHVLSLKVLRHPQCATYCPRHYHCRTSKAERMNGGDGIAFLTHSVRQEREWYSDGRFVCSDAQQEGGYPSLPRGWLPQST